MLTDKNLAKRRWIIFSVMFVAWSAIYVCRRSFASSMTYLADTGLTTDNLGMISSCFATTYGFSKFASSVLSDRASATVMLAMCLALSGFCCIAFPLLGNVWYLCFIWAVQGLVQGLGWPACAKILRNWYPPSELGRWWSILSSSGNLSSALLPIFLAYSHRVAGWSFGFYAAGACSFVMAGVAAMVVRDSPRPAGDGRGTLSLPSVDKTAQRSGHSGLLDVLFSPALWLACVVYASLSAVKSATADWGQLYFIEEAKIPETVAAALITTIHIGGVAGNLSLGYISDLVVTRWPQTERTRVSRSPVLLAIAIALVSILQLFASTVTMESSQLWLSFLCFNVGFLVEGGISVISLLTIGLVPDSQAGSAHGLACLVAQGGTFMAGWPFSLVVKNTSWTEAYQLLVACPVTVMVVGFYFVMVLKREVKQKLR